MNQDEKQKLKAAVTALYFWAHENDTSFTARLFSLIKSADLENRGKLMTAFPFECLALMEWENSASEVQFFEQWRACDEIPSEQQSDN